MNQYQEESELINAYRAMHFTDRAIMLDHAKSRAAAERARWPALRLAFDRANPARNSMFRSTSS